MHKLITSKEVKDIVVFIPALNEEGKIGETISRVQRIYMGSEARGFKVRIIVVDDGSKDKTAAIAESHHVPVAAHPRNLGLGAATRTGMRTAYEMGADVAIKLDADLQHAPEDIERVVKPILDGKADIVYGSRFAGEIKYRMPFVRWCGNKFFTALMRLLTDWPITDAQTGMMAYSRRYLSVFDMPSDYNPPHQTIIDAFHKHMRYAEVPVVFYPRTSGKSFVSMKYPFQAFFQIGRILVATNPLRVFLPLSFCFIAVALVWGGGEVYLNHIDPSAEFHDTSILLLVICGIQTFFFGILADMICIKK